VLTTLDTIRRRRAALASRLRPTDNFTALEESCVPSYCHRNVAAAAVAWWRLAKAAALCRRWSPPGAILDFGAATGEIAHLIGGDRPYHFVEADEALAKALVDWHPNARREHIEHLPPRAFHTILALDSLEHNENLEDITIRLAESLADDGVFIVSGPTESPLYRLGRRVAGFGGHYHKHTVFDVERAVARSFTLEHVVSVPPLARLFRISVWRAASS
jgi:hypothetical protein